MKRVKYIHIYSLHTLSFRKIIPSLKQVKYLRTIELST